MAISKTKQKEQRIAAIKLQYKIPFDIEDAAVDLREMVKNYPGGIIPFRDIGAVIDAVNGPPVIPRNSVDPRGLKTPKFAWIEMSLLGINPIFQRDVMPNHIDKIESKFESDMIIVPCAVKCPITGLFLLWDGHHTARVCERMGWTHLPIWYTEAILDPNKSYEEALESANKDLIYHAGKSSITNNKNGKRELDRYNEHCMNYEIGDSKAGAIQNIVNLHNCQIKRVSKHAGDISDINLMYKSYDLTQTNSGVKGVYLSRSLSFHRKTWPLEVVRNYMMLSMAALYHTTENQTGILLPPDFDVELGNILTKNYGPSLAVSGEDDPSAIGLRGAFLKHNNLDSIKATGDLLGIITSGLILIYHKHGSGRFKLATPTYNYPIL